MDLSEILSISGKPGLYKMVSQTKNSLVVESLEDKKRFPAFSSERISALDDISIYTEDGDAPLREVMQKIAEKENKGQCISHKEDNDELKVYFKQILPHYDEDRVYVSDIKKVFRWYNTLQKLNLLEVLEEKEEDKAEEKKVEDKEVKEEPKEAKNEKEEKEVKEEKPKKKTTAKSSSEKKAPAKKTTTQKKTTTKSKQSPSSKTKKEEKEKDDK